MYQAAARPPGMWTNPGNPAVNYSGARGMGRGRVPSTVVKPKITVKFGAKMTAAPPPSDQQAPPKHMEQPPPPPEPMTPPPTPPVTQRKGAASPPPYSVPKSEPKRPLAPTPSSGLSQETVTTSGRSTPKFRARMIKKSESSLTSRDEPPSLMKPFAKRAVPQPPTPPIEAEVKRKGKKQQEHGDDGVVRDKSGRKYVMQLEPTAMAVITASSSSQYEEIHEAKAEPKSKQKKTTPRKVPSLTTNSGLSNQDVMPDEFDLELKPKRRKQAPTPDVYDDDMSEIVVEPQKGKRHGVTQPKRHVTNGSELDEELPKSKKREAIKPSPEYDSESFPFEKRKGKKQARRELIEEPSIEEVSLFEEEKPKAKPKRVKVGLRPTKDEFWSEQEPTEIAKQKSKKRGTMQVPSELDKEETTVKGKTKKGQKIKFITTEQEQLVLSDETAYDVEMVETPAVVKTKNEKRKERDDKKDTDEPLNKLKLKPKKVALSQQGDDVLKDQGKTGGRKKKDVHVVEHEQKERRKLAAEMVQETKSSSSESTTTLSTSSVAEEQDHSTKTHRLTAITEVESKKQEKEKTAVKTPKAIREDKPQKMQLSGKRAAERPTEAELKQKGHHKELKQLMKDRVTEKTPKLEEKSEKYGKSAGKADRKHGKDKKFEVEFEVSSGSRAAAAESGEKEPKRSHKHKRKEKELDVAKGTRNTERQLLQKVLRETEVKKKRRVRSKSPAMKMRLGPDKYVDSIKIVLLPAKIIGVDVRATESSSSVTTDDDASSNASTTAMKDYQFIQPSTEPSAPPPSFGEVPLSGEQYRFDTTPTPNLQYSTAEMMCRRNAAWAAEAVERGSYFRQPFFSPMMANDVPDASQGIAAPGQGLLLGNPQQGFIMANQFVDNNFYLELLQSLSNIASAGQAVVTETNASTDKMKEGEGESRSFVSGDTDIENAFSAAHAEEVITSEEEKGPSFFTSPTDRRSFSTVTIQDIAPYMIVSSEQIGTDESMREADEHLKQTISQVLERQLNAKSPASNLSLLLSAISGGKVLEKPCTGTLSTDSDFSSRDYHLSSSQGETLAKELRTTMPSLADDSFKPPFVPTDVSKPIHERSFVTNKENEVMPETNTLQTNEKPMQAFRQVEGSWYSIGSNVSASPTATSLPVKVKRPQTLTLKNTTSLMEPDIYVGSELKGNVDQQLQKAEFPDEAESDEINEMDVLRMNAVDSKITDQKTVTWQVTVLPAEKTDSAGIPIPDEATVNLQASFQNFMSEVVEMLVTDQRASQSLIIAEDVEGDSSDNNFDSQYQDHQWHVVPRTSKVGIIIQTPDETYNLTEKLSGSTISTTAVNRFIDDTRALEEMELAPDKHFMEFGAVDNGKKSEVVAFIDKTNNAGLDVTNYSAPRATHQKINVPMEYDSVLVTGLTPPEENLDKHLIPATELVKLTSSTTSKNITFDESPLEPRVEESKDSKHSSNATFKIESEQKLVEESYLFAATLESTLLENKDHVYITSHEEIGKFSKEAVPSLHESKLQPDKETAEMVKISLEAEPSTRETEFEQDENLLMENEEKILLTSSEMLAKVPADRLYMPSSEELEREFEENRQRFVVSNEELGEVSLPSKINLQDSQLESTGTAEDLENVFVKTAFHTVKDVTSLRSLPSTSEAKRIAKNLEMENDNDETDQEGFGDTTKVKLSPEHKSIIDGLSHRGSGGSQFDTEITTSISYDSRKSIHGEQAYDSSSSVVDESLKRELDLIKQSIIKSTESVSEVKIARQIGESQDPEDLDTEVTTGKQDEEYEKYDYVQEPATIETMKPTESYVIVLEQLSEWSSAVENTAGKTSERHPDAMVVDELFPMQGESMTDERFIEYEDFSEQPALANRPDISRPIGLLQDLDRKHSTGSNLMLADNDFFTEGERTVTNDNVEWDFKSYDDDISEKLTPGLSFLSEPSQTRTRLTSVEGELPYYIIPVITPGYSPEDGLSYLKEVKVMPYYETEAEDAFQDIVTRSHLSEALVTIKEEKSTDSEIVALKSSVDQHASKLYSSSETDKEAQQSRYPEYEGSYKPLESQSYIKSSPSSKSYTSKRSSKSEKSVVSLQLPESTASIKQLQQLGLSEHTSSDILQDENYAADTSFLLPTQGHDIKSTVVESPLSTDHGVGFITSASIDTLASNLSFELDGQSTKRSNESAFDQDKAEIHLHQVKESSINSLASSKSARQSSSWKADQTESVDVLRIKPYPSVKSTVSYLVEKSYLPISDVQDAKKETTSHGTKPIIKTYPSLRSMKSDILSDANLLSSEPKEHPSASGSLLGFSSSSSIKSEKALGVKDDHSGDDPSIKSIVTLKEDECDKISKTDHTKSLQQIDSSIKSHAGSKANVNVERWPQHAPTAIDHSSSGHDRLVTPTKVQSVASTGSVKSKRTDGLLSLTKGSVISSASEKSGLKIDVHSRRAEQGDIQNDRSVVSAGAKSTPKVTSYFRSSGSVGATEDALRQSSATSSLSDKSDSRKTRAEDPWAKAEEIIAKNKWLKASKESGIYSTKSKSKLKVDTNSFSKESVSGISENKEITNPISEPMSLSPSLGDVVDKPTERRKDLSLTSVEVASLQKGSASSLFRSTEEKEARESSVTSRSHSSEQKVSVSSFSKTPDEEWKKETTELSGVSLSTKSGIRAIEELGSSWASEAAIEHKSQEEIKTSLTSWASVHSGIENEFPELKLPDNDAQKVLVGSVRSHNTKSVIKDTDKLSGTWNSNVTVEDLNEASLASSVSASTKRKVSGRSVKSPEATKIPLDTSVGSLSRKSISTLSGDKEALSEDMQKMSSEEPNAESLSPTPETKGNEYFLGPWASVATVQDASHKETKTLSLKSVSISSNATKETSNERISGAVSPGHGRKLPSEITEEVIQKDNLTPSASAASNQRVPARSASKSPDERKKLLSERSFASFGSKSGAQDTDYLVSPWGSDATVDDKSQKEMKDGSVAFSYTVLSEPKVGPQSASKQPDGTQKMLFRPSKGSLSTNSEAKGTEHVVSPWSSSVTVEDASKRETKDPSSCTSMTMSITKAPSNQSNESLSAKSGVSDATVIDESQSKTKDNYLISVAASRTLDEETSKGVDMQMTKSLRSEAKEADLVSSWGFDASIKSVNQVDSILTPTSTETDEKLQENILLGQQDKQSRHWSAAEPITDERSHDSTTSSLSSKSAIQANDYPDLKEMEHIYDTIPDPLLGAKSRPVVSESSGHQKLGDEVGKESKLTFDSKFGAKIIRHWSAAEPITGDKSQEPGIRTSTSAKSRPKILLDSYGIASADWRERSEPKEANIVSPITTKSGPNTVQLYSKLSTRDKFSDTSRELQVTSHPSSGKSESRAGESIASSPSAVEKLSSRSLQEVKDLNVTPSISTKSISKISRKSISSFQKDDESTPVSAELSMSSLSAYPSPTAVQNEGSSAKKQKSSISEKSSKLSSLLEDKQPAMVKRRSASFQKDPSGDAADGPKTLKAASRTSHVSEKSIRAGLHSATSAGTNSNSSKVLEPSIASSLSTKSGKRLDDTTSGEVISTTPKVSSKSVKESPPTEVGSVPKIGISSPLPSLTENEKFASDLSDVDDGLGKSSIPSIVSSSSTKTLPRSSEKPFSRTFLSEASEYGSIEDTKKLSGLALDSEKSSMTDIKSRPNIMAAAETVAERSSSYSSTDKLTHRTESVEFKGPRRIASTDEKSRKTGSSVDEIPIVESKLMTVKSKSGNEFSRVNSVSNETVGKRTSSSEVASPTEKENELTIKSSTSSKFSFAPQNDEMVSSNVSVGEEFKKSTGKLSTPSKSKSRASSKSQHLEQDRFDDPTEQNKPHFRLDVPPFGGQMVFGVKTPESNVAADDTAESDTSTAMDVKGSKTTHESETESTRSEVSKKTSLSVEGKVRETSIRSSSTKSLLPSISSSISSKSTYSGAPDKIIEVGEFVSSGTIPTPVSASSKKSFVSQKSFPSIKSSASGKSVDSARVKDSRPPSTVWEEPIYDESVVSKSLVSGSKSSNSDVSTKMNYLTVEQVSADKGSHSSKGSLVSPTEERERSQKSTDSMSFRLPQSNKEASSALSKTQADSMKAGVEDILSSDKEEFFESDLNTETTGEGVTDTTLFKSGTIPLKMNPKTFDGVNLGLTPEKDSTRKSGTGLSGSIYDERGLKSSDSKKAVSVDGSSGKQSPDAILANLEVDRIISSSEQQNQKDETRSDRSPTTDASIVTESYVDNGMLKPLGFAQLGFEIPETVEEVDEEVDESDPKESESLHESEVKNFTKPSDASEKKVVPTLRLRPVARKSNSEEEAD